MINIKQKNADVIRISLLSHDYKLLEEVLDRCTKAISLSGGSFKGPVHLPNRKHLTTLLTSPHVYKTSLEQFALTIYKAIIDVKCGPSTLSTLKDLNISGGVEIKIAIKRGLNNEKK